MISFSAGARDVSLFQYPDWLGTHPASYSVGTGGSFPRGRGVGSMKLTIYLHLMLWLRTNEL
jgi:hypothetical protein